MSDVTKQTDENSSHRQYVHDVRNTLNGVAMQAELAKAMIERGNADAAIEAVDRILAKCKHLSAAE